jgi:5,10-methylenetetrahydromethanopterin reductase
MTRFFLRTYSFPQVMELVAEQAEQAGWDGLMLQDSQNLSPDLVVALTLAARATENLTIGTAVTNLVTRDPAVVAGAFATLDLVSDGRAMLGLARGDTALRLIGREPPHMAQFADLVKQVRGYLAGQDVTIGQVSSRIAWLDPQVPPKVPVNLFASGPKNLALAARLGDVVTMSLGAEPDQIAWGLEQVRAVDPAVPVGALIVAATGTDRDGLREYVRGNASISTHFRRGAEGVLPAADRAVVEAVDHDYELYGHSEHGSRQAEDLPADFIDRFCVIGEPHECVERLRGLIDLGLDHIIVVGGGLDASSTLRLQMDMRFAREVLPALR